MAQTNGCIVTWKAPHRVRFDVVRAALFSANLDTGVASDMTPKQGVTRALADMKEGRVICKYSADDHGRVSYQLTKEIISACGVQYGREAVVSLDTATGIVSGDVPEIVLQAQTLLDEHINTRNSGDITRMVQRLVDKHGGDLVPLREAGGVYYIPERHAYLVNSLRAFLSDIGGGLSTFAVAVGQSDQPTPTDVSIADSLSTYMSGLLAEWREYTSKLNADSKAFMIDRGVERMGTLRAKLNAYRDLLGATASAIESDMDKADASLMAAITSGTVVMS